MKVRGLVAGIVIGASLSSGIAGANDYVNDAQDRAKAQTHQVRETSSKDQQIEVKRSRNGRDVYKLWRGSGRAPLSIVFVRRCIRAEDSASWVRLNDYDAAVTIYGCKEGA